MGKQSSKSEIYSKLDKLDEEGLNLVNEIVTAYLKKTDDKEQWNPLSQEDRVAIEEGLEQIEWGEYYTFDEVREMIRKEFSI